MKRDNLIWGYVKIAIIPIAALRSGTAPPAIASPQPSKIGKTQSSKTAQDKQVPETTPFWVHGQVHVIQCPNLLHRQVNSVRFLVQYLKVGQVDRWNYLPAHTIPEEDTQPLDARPDRVLFQPAGPSADAYGYAHK